MSWECPKCGVVNPAEAAFCSCGHGSNQRPKSYVQRVEGSLAGTDSKAELEQLKATIPYISDELALRVVEDIKDIVPPLSQEPQIPKQSIELSLEFRGSPREYFRIWIVNLCISLCTLGIFSAWAKVRRKRYVYSHTILGGTPFQYLGQPIPILKGRLIAGAGFLLYYVSTHYFTSLLPYVLGAGIIVAPWVIVRSVAFNARYSAFRNMTFHFSGGYFQALKVLYAWPLIPALVIGIMFVFHWQAKPVFAIAFIFTAVLFPWWMRRFKKFIIEHTSFGSRQGDFSATGGQFFKIYLLAGLIMIAVLVPVGVLVGVLFATKHSVLPYVMAAPTYAGYVLAFAFLKSRSDNLVWNHTVLGPIHFQSTLRSRDLLRLYVTNALGIVASLGLLIPWAVVRTIKYRADNTHVLQAGSLTDFEGSDLNSVAAVGAETLDFFDVDLSL